MSSSASVARYYLERSGIRLRWRSLVFFEKRLDVQESVPALTDVAIENVTLAGLRPRHLIGWLDSAEAAQLLSRPDVRFFVAEIDGEVVGSCWLETAVVQLAFLDHEEPLPSDTAYLSHLVVAPGLRGHAIAPALLAFAGKFAAELGKTRLTSACVPENAAVQRVFAKTGWQSYLRADYRCLFGLRWYRTERLADGETSSWLTLGLCSLRVF